MAETTLGDQLSARDVVIRIKNLSKTYITSKNKSIRALEDINFDVVRGEFICLVGPSGCGKSTLLNIIGGLDQPTAGEVLIQNPSGRGTKLAIIFQNPLLLPWRTVWKNIQFSLEGDCGIPREEWEERIKSAIDLVGLTGFEEAFPSQLSGGMQTRTSIARALVIDPDILLMDEPFGALDEITRRRLQSELLRIWQKTRKTIVFVTHSVSEAAYLADRVVLFTPRPGRVQALFQINIPRPRIYGDENLLKIELKILRELEKVISLHGSKEES